MKNIFIGIAGGTASGKTTVSKKLHNGTKDFGSVSILRMDDYYKSFDELSLEERKKINYDHPNSYDVDLFIDHLKKLKAGQAINKPIYDFVNHKRSDEIEVIFPADVIIIEGIMLFAIPELLPFYDIKVFVDTPNDIRFIRRLQRDINERGRTLESVITQYLTTVRPMHMQFVEPSKIHADLIVPEGGENLVAMDVLITKITNILTNVK